jgi:hypothetical protein
MNKKLFGLLLLAGLSWVYAESRTSRVGLTKPDLNSTGWATKTNTNWDIIDSSMAIQGYSNTFSGNNTYSGTETFTGPVTITSGTITGFNSSASTISILTAPLIRGTTITASSATLAAAEIPILTVNSINGKWPNPNILINGGFELWQRYVSTTNLVNAKYGPDRWKLDTDEANFITVSTDTPNAKTGTYGMKLAVSGTNGTHYWGLYQPIENYLDYLGSTVTFSCVAKSTVATAISLQLGDGVNNTFSSYHTGGGGWETLSITTAIAPNASQLFVYAGFVNTNNKKNGIYYVDNCTLTVGSKAVPFIARTFAEELVLAQRYYEKSYPLYTKPGTSEATNILTVVGNPVSASAANYNEVYYKSTKYAVPTLTIYLTDGTAGQMSCRGSGSTYTSRSAIVQQSGIHGFALAQSAVNNEGLCEFHWTAESEL